MTKLFFIFISFLLCTCAFAQSPSIASFSPSSGSVGSLVNITGTNLSNPTVLTIGGASVLPISNTGTNLVAMVMPGTVTGKVKIITSTGSDSANSNFTVVASLPPNTQQGGKLVGTGVIGWAAQGVSSAISADGNTTIVGGFVDNNFKGAVWVYTRTNGIWSQQGNKLFGTGSVGFEVEQGQMVSLSADGNTLISISNKDNNGKGAIWVFVRNNGVWSQQGNKLTITNVQISSASLSGDGNTIVLGGYSENNTDVSAWIFVRNNGVWSQQNLNILGSPAIGYASSAVVVSTDGNTIGVCGAGDNAGIGGAWIFVRKNGVWSQQGSKLVGSDAVGIPNQGGDPGGVSLSADGNSIIIGGHNDNYGQGAAWVFKRTGTTWSQLGTKLVGTGVVGYAAQGSSVSICADGNTIVIGGWADDSYKGAVWVFKFINNLWVQQGNKLVGTGTIGEARQGQSVAISADGNTLIVGGHFDNMPNPPGNAPQGAGWIFTYSFSLPVTISNFKTYQKSTGIQLEWKTQNETNLSSYEVEKSTDGFNFSKAGVLSATGLSTYNWFDANSNNANNYYRLKMIDKDGSFKYSSILNVNINSIKNVFNIAGNPVKNNILVLQMENVDKGNYALSIYNNLGQQMINKTIVHQGGSATQTFSLGTVSAGTYQLSIIGNNVKITKTILVE